MKRILLLCTIACGLGISTLAREKKPVKGNKILTSLKKDSLGTEVQKIVKDATRKKGLFNVFFNEKTGKLYFQIPDSAFSNEKWLDCKELKSVIIPDTVTTIGKCAFFGCENLASITLPNSLTEIGEYAFYGCEKLTSIIIPNSVVEIGRAAFECCGSLKTITLPASLTKIGISLFFYCGALETIYVPEDYVHFFKNELVGKGAFLHEPHPQIVAFKE